MFYWHFVDLIWLFVYFITYASLRLYNQNIFATFLYMEVITKQSIIC